MGLDQGLFIKKAGKGNNKFIEIAYFRKCNQLHGWIVRNIIDKYDNIGNFDSWNDKRIEITKEDLAKLRSDVKTVIKKSKLRPGIIRNGYRIKEVYGSPVRVYNHEFGKKIMFKKTAKKLLPTYEGPFFGSYDYDEYYYEQLLDIDKELDKLDEYDLDRYKLYYWAWW